MMMMKKKSEEKVLVQINISLSYHHDGGIESRIRYGQVLGHKAGQENTTTGLDDNLHV
jgi:hypothetical protein